MGDNSVRETMFELFIFETRQLLEELEQEILQCEKTGQLDGSIDAIFRIMHTVKGSAALMQFTNISEVAHAVEDLFFVLREKKLRHYDTGKIIDLVLEGVDFIKGEIVKAEQREEVKREAAPLTGRIKDYLQVLTSETQKLKPNVGKRADSGALLEKLEPNIPVYHAVVKFEQDCGFEDLQAFAVINNLKQKAVNIRSNPESYIDDDTAIKIIKESGLQLFFQSELSLEELQKMLERNAFVAEVRLEQGESGFQKPDKLKTIILDDEPEKPSVNMAESAPISEAKVAANPTNHSITKQSLISVSVNKLDLLLDLVGELVISEAMVTRHPELEGLPLENYSKAARQLRKITNELQDVVMSIRMVPLAGTFQKMQRIVRDMSRKLGKEVELKVVGEETEVDKNIIEHISDPLMHLIRNAMDHGIETAAERRDKRKPENGTVTLEAKNAGGDVLIRIIDDGRGLHREQILEKAKKNGLLTKDAHELSDREVFGFILLPGFSTKEEVTEFSGRGVGMDVVMKSIEAVGGTVLIDSTPDVGTMITLKIPLTLAIIDGITVRVGNSQYTVPTTSIRESFRMKPEELITDPDGNEMIMIRGECYPVIRLHQLFNVQTTVVQIDQGVIMMIENNGKGICLFADELLGEQQVVVKALPKYVKKVKGIAGCTLLGDGSISLILDATGLIQMSMKS